AGVLLNYTQARSVNIRLTENATNTSIYLLRARLTRSIAHNNKIRDISESDGMKSGSMTGASGSTVRYAGLKKDVASKLVDKLHPKECKISMPGSCTSKLYHCDDSLTNCAESTDASINESGTGYCLWNIPCTFSVYSGDLPDTGGDDTPPSGGSGGGGGGGGGAASSISSSSTSAFWQTLPAGTATMNVGEDKIGFEKMTFLVNKAATNAEIKITATSKQPSAVPENLIDKVYQFIIIDFTNLAESDVGRAEITFKVARQWLTDNGAVSTDVLLKRWSEADSKWTTYTPTITSSDSTYVHYSIKTAGLSYYAIVAVPKTIEPEKKEEAVVEEQKPVEEIKTSEENLPVDTTLAEEPTKAGLSLIQKLAIAVAVVLVITAVLVVLQRERIKKKGNLEGELKKKAEELEKKYQSGGEPKEQHKKHAK
ncbi:PGF-pre-PGF domain-containing protein, partial [Candidatus Woesearchaeota archaeon]|nr:PGF-pre-PGF domain-containing protein [Candidatus Woesearchaeota archaeon]